MIVAIKNFYLICIISAVVVNYLDESLELSFCDVMAIASPACKSRCTLVRTNCTYRYRGERISGRAEHAVRARPVRVPPRCQTDARPARATSRIVHDSFITEISLWISFFT